MHRVALYSLLLIAGMVAAQSYNLVHYHYYIRLLTMVCLGYIMIEVGLEFIIDKKNLGGYAKDFLIAVSAASLPWFFCAAYFYWVIGASAGSSVFVSLFSAPTSAGVLFTMLGAAGLGVTWLFKKARILAIFDDIATILFIIPMQFLFVGVSSQAFYLLIILLLLIIIAYLALHSWRLPISSPWLLLYSTLIVAVCKALHHFAYIELEVILPAFCFGALLFNPHDPAKQSEHEHEHEYIEPEEFPWKLVDAAVKYSFMFLVGCSMPRILMGYHEIGQTAVHVLMITLISNLGKIVPAFFYRDEASLRERIALSIAMFPRGEVGAGVLLIALGYGLQSKLIAIGALSLELNLLLTGVFITIVIWLIKPRQRKPA